MNRRYTKGFTLLEIIIATFLFGGLVVGVSALSGYYLNNFSFSLEEQQSVNQIHGALTRLTREIREARTGDHGGWPIISAQDNEFIFYSDVTNDGRTDRVRYFLDGSELKRGIVQPSNVPVEYQLSTEIVSTVVSNIEQNGNNIFTYYNGDYPADTTSNPLLVSQRLLSTRLIGVYIRLNISPNTGSQPYESSASVQIRSMKDNL